MSSLEEKLKRISGELEAYRQMEGPTPQRENTCLHEVFHYDLAEVSGGLLGYADGQTLSIVCRAEGFGDWDITRAAFVDTETTGLMGGTGTVAFLIGLGYVADGRFTVEQFFMQDYDVEQEMLSRLCRRLDDFDYLVTFNGKCFDGPLIASRAVLNRVRQPLDDMEQVDLLHAARRIYKKRLKHCDLQTLEREVLGHTRQGDVDGLSSNKDTVLAALPELQPRAKTVLELIDLAQFIYASRPLAIDAAASALLTADTRAVLKDMAETLRGLNEWSVPAIDAAMRALAEAKGLKLGKLAQPLRAALTGRTVSPGIFEVMVLIGKAESLARIGDQATA